MPQKISLAEVNNFSEQQFVSHFGEIVEHAPWVAKAAWAQRPFATVAELAKTMADIMQQHSETWLTILNAHPELSGKEAETGSLTEFSAREQAGIGLDRLSSADFLRLRQLNQQYRQKFDFPFIVCVGRVASLAQLFSQFEQRIANDATQELHTALSEVGKIAEVRLQSLILSS